MGHTGRDAPLWPNRDDDCNSAGRVTSLRNNQRALLRPILASISQLLSALDGYWFENAALLILRAPRLRQVDSPGICTYDFPKKVHYPVSCPVSCHWDGGENADGAEPAAG
jgi:hypothetical protein